jgi:1,4-alpha-glucan branching enzyme
MDTGYLSIVLHAHLPFVKHPEHRQSLEESWLYEAMTDTYIPLLDMMGRLLRDEVPFRITISVTPTLSAMLTDPLLQTRYVAWLQRLVALGEREIRRTSGEGGLNRLARYYRDRFARTKRAFVDTYGKDLVQAFRRFSDQGCLEIIGSAATHGYLPLLSPNPSAVRAQLRVGAAAHEQMFGARPKGFWLPECGYYPGLDRLLAEEGIGYTFLESHGVTRARPTPAHGVYAPVECPSGTAVFGRDPDSSKQVWSATEGYPGDFDYREYYRDIAFDLDLEEIGPYLHPKGIRVDTGYKYYRVTGPTEEKELYVPERADEKARIHARHFLSEREAQFKRLAAQMGGRPPLVVAPYDAELFGHWWYEGPRWIEHLIRAAAERRAVRLVTPSDYLDEISENPVAEPGSSSWGAEGFNDTWLNGENDWIYRHLHRGAEVMEHLAARHPETDGLTRRALAQAGRELLLAQASDWAFMIRTGAMTEYATNRTKGHLLELLRLNREIEDGHIDGRRLAALERRHRLFPRLDYRCFCRDPDRKRKLERIDPNQGN